MSKVDFNVDASSVNVEWNNGQTVDLSVVGVDLDQLIERIGVNAILDEMNIDEISDFLKEKGYEVDNE